MVVVLQPVRQLKSYRPTWPHPVEFSYHAGYIPLRPTKKKTISWDRTMKYHGYPT